MKDLIKATKTPVRLIVIAYSIIQASVYVIFSLDNAPQRIIISALMIFLVLFVTKIKGLTRLHLSIIMPLSIAAVELIAASVFTEGNRLIYIFLIGASLVSFLYVNVKGLFISNLIICTAVVILITVFDIRLLGPSYSSNDDLFSFFGMAFNFVVIQMIGKYSVGMLSRSQQTGVTFDKVLQETSSLIVIVNNEARVEYISKSFAKILDIEKQEYAINLPFVDLFPNIELKYFFGELLERYGTIETTFDIKTKVEASTANGQPSGLQPEITRSFLLHSIPMGKIDPNSGNFGIARFFDCVEITPIIESQRTAEAATRSKSEFLAMMSHEIRTPLNAIIGISQIQLEDSSLPDKYAAAQEKILTSGSSLLGIINDILDMSKIETGKLQSNIMEYDTPSFINDTIQLNIVRIGSKPIKFILDINENLPSKLFGDELRLKQILNNLLSNAFKYTEGGHVKLSVKHAVIDNSVYLSFDIEDTGQGLKEEDKKRLFTEYLRFNSEANRNTEGTGLGLNITQKLVEMMDGKITVESEYGKGSVFSVTVKQGMNEYIPIGKELTDRLCSFTYSGEKQAVKLQILREIMPYGKVLVVDDVETNLFVAEGLLKPYKLSIETVNSGFSAIEKIKNGRVYDIIFMDHMMPVMDGIETTDKIRRLGYGHPIVALTANALSGNDEMFAQKGFDGFIPKPIDIRILNNTLIKYIKDKNPEEAKKYISETVIENEQQEITPKMIQVFCRDTEKAIKILKVKDDIKLFNTTVHAMKSALWNIGEKDTSEIASALEEAGRRNDFDYISANTGKFINQLSKLINHFNSMQLNSKNNDAAGNDIKEDKEFLNTQLLTIKTACADYDIDTAINALKILKEKPWKKTTLVLIENIFDLLYLNSDFENAALMCDRF
ncbi:MAG: ATP-binding protein [Treponema sp.]|nr:ATP-binding protein [Treponema sp.]